jgi:DNA-binding transcriptional MocR family regulator
MNKLEEIIKRYQPKMMYTMVSCQNPTGYTYSQKKKEELLVIAKKYNMYILEDDYVGELIYSKQNMLSLKSMDKYNQVIYIKSFSKILMPGLRLGFMIVPDLLNQSVLNAKQAKDISTSGLIQRAFDVYLRNGQWEKQLKQMKKIYFKRYQKMTEALNKHLPRSVNYYVPKGGILFWIELPKNMDSRLFFETIKFKEIAIVPGDMFYYADRKSNAIRLSIAAVQENEIEDGIILLCEYLRDFLSLNKQKERLPIL